MPRQLERQAPLEGIPFTEPVVKDTSMPIEEFFYRDQQRQTGARGRQPTYSASAAEIRTLNEERQKKEEQAARAARKK